MTIINVSWPAGRAGRAHDVRSGYAPLAQQRRGMKAHSGRRIIIHMLFSSGCMTGLSDDLVFFGNGEKLKLEIWPELASQSFSEEGSGRSIRSFSLPCRSAFVGDVSSRRRRPSVAQGQAASLLTVTVTMHVRYLS